MKNIRYSILISICFVQASCEDFVEVDVPDHKIVSETVFGSDEAANSAVIGIYNELFKANFSSGGIRSITLLGDLSSDNLQITNIDDEMIEFEQNEILVQNSFNLALWSSAYNIIYMCNAIMDGLENYNGVSKELKDKLMGEVQFVRAFVYFYLVNLYDEVPLIQASDYRLNALASRSTIENIYNLIIADLENAVASLGDTYEDGNRIRPNKFAAMSLLARVYLYLEDWGKAEIFSTEVINNTGNYALIRNLDEVFLVDSKEAIWQISPVGGGALSFITNEARMFILTSPPPQAQTPVALTVDLMGTFPNGDIRPRHWIGELKTESQVYYYPFKYKMKSSNDITEYSMVMRLAEQYLIQAEA